MKPLAKQWQVGIGFIASSLALLVIGLATRWGIGLNGDATAYIGAAQNLLAGNGLTVSPNTGATGTPGPLTHFPPLYSLLLAGAGLTGFDLLTGARWLNGMLFVVNSALAARILWTMTRSPWAAFLGSVSVVLSFPLIYVHANAWTEPLLICFGLVGLLLLADFCRTQDRLRLWGAAGAFALAFLARYLGLGLILGGIVGLLFFGPGTHRRRLTDGLRLGLLSCTPTGLWLIRNFTAAGSLTDRRLVFRPIEYDQVYIGLAQVAGWLLPPTTPRLHRAVAAFLILAWVALICWKALAKGKMTGAGVPVLNGLLGVSVIAFVLFLAVSLTFVDYSTPIDSRILSPVYLSLLLMSVAALCTLISRFSGHATLGIGSRVVSLALGSIVVLRGAGWLAQRYGVGDVLAHASPEWQDSTILDEIRRLPPDTPIYTNDQIAVYLFAGRQSYVEPQVIHPETGEPMPNFIEAFATMKADMTSADGVLVFFNAWRSPSEADLLIRLPLVEVIHAPEGVIYRLTSTGLSENWRVGGGDE